jgi:hypothetical protein
VVRPEVKEVKACYQMRRANYPELKSVSYVVRDVNLLNPYTLMV